MEWTPEATDLVERVNARIPAFVRGMVRRVVSRESERLAAEAGTGPVTADHVRRAYQARTPKPMLPMLRQALGEGGPPGAGVAAEPVFPVGQPMSREEMEAYLAWEGTGRLGTSDASGQPYVVPLSFVYDGGFVYYHWFQDQGRKVANIGQNEKVCFEADWATRDQLSYRSVIADGVVEEVGDLAEKARVLDLLAAKFPAYATGEGHAPDVQEIIGAGREAMAEAVSIFRVRIARMTGKKKGTGPLEAAAPEKREW